MTVVETRKVQVTGRSTYVVSLPKKWVNKVHVKSGDSLVLVPLADGTLIINPQLSKADINSTEKRIEIDPQDSEEMVRKFIGAYLAGFDMVVIKGNKQRLRNMRQDVLDMVHKVIGMEIIDDGNNTVTIKDLLDASDLSLLRGVKRMYSITREMLRDAMAVLDHKDASLAEDVMSRDDQVDKLCWMVTKQYNLIVKNVFYANKMDITPQAALGYMLIARSIERIADHATKIAYNAMQVHETTEVAAKIIETSTQLVHLLDDTVNAFYLNKFDYANIVMNKLRDLQEPIEQLKHEILAHQADAVTIMGMAYIVDSLERTRSYGMDIAESAINHYFATV